METLLLRHRVIGTRAELASRINTVYQNFKRENPDIQPIINKVNEIKNITEWWWSYLNTAELEHIAPRIPKESEETMNQFLGKKQISARKDKIVKFILESF